MSAWRLQSTYEECRQDGGVIRAKYKRRVPFRTSIILMGGEPIPPGTTYLEREHVVEHRYGTMAEREVIMLLLDLHKEHGATL